MAISNPHPNLAVLQQFDPTNLAAATHIFAENVVFHYYNPRLPEFQGDYVGFKGIESFFQKIGGKTNGTFKVKLISATPMGDELVVTHTQNSMIIDSRQIEIDVVEVWRIVNGKIHEIWDIPSAYTSVAK